MISRLCFGFHRSNLAWGRPLTRAGIPMNRRTLLLSLFGGLAAAPSIIAAASSVEAAPLPEARPPTLEPLSEPAPASAITETDLEGVRAAWSQGVRRRMR